MILFCLLNFKRGKQHFLLKFLFLDNKIFNTEGTGDFDVFSDSEL